jgi:DNA-binding MarR family transcriptional regulator
MGRKKQTQPPLDPEFIRQAFTIGDNSRQIIRRSTGEVATFVQRGKLLCRVYVDGRIQRVVAAKLAWIMHTGQHPRGLIRHRDGDGYNFAAGNLIEIKRGPRPFTQSAGGKASSLANRANVTTRLLQTLAEHPGQTLPVLARSIHMSMSCCCHRLSQLADAGLCIGPKCDARARWDLSQQGRELAMSGKSIIDAKDIDILRIIARSPMRQLELARRLQVCSLTARRRVDLLIARGLINADERRRFRITDAGLAALPDLPPRWLKTEMVSAALSPDVQARLASPNDLSPAERSRLSSQIAHKARIGRPRQGKYSYDAAFSERHAQAG